MHGLFARESPPERACSSGESRRQGGTQEDERAYLPEGAALKPEGVPDADEPRLPLGVLAGSAIEFPQKPLSALLVPQET